MAGDIGNLSTEGPLLQDDYRTSGKRKAKHAHSKAGGPMDSTHVGRVTSIDEHHSNAKHATITVTHGKKKRDKSSGELVGYSRPDSRVTIPKAHAKNFTLGQRVNVGVTAAPAGGDADNDGAGEVQESAPAPTGGAPAKKSAKKSAKKAASKKAPAKKLTKKLGAKKPSLISQAMMGGK